jgi:2-polyprenyl-3-methyl-5-hydroxy-6-metoxy-1,4-benzoquinol methylase
LRYCAAPFLRAVRARDTGLTPNESGMKTELLDFILCPDCRDELEITDAQWADGEVESGELRCRSGGHKFPIAQFIPRFVEEDDYADAFAIEWNTFRTAHLDSYTGLKRLDAEFRSFIDFPIERLQGKLVADAGCGLGRFSEIALNYGARVIAFDMSRAIDAAFQNLNGRGNIHFLQADVFRLPLREGLFDLVYSTGVLHHTPDPPAAFRSLPPLVRPGGRIFTMVYAKYNKAYLSMVEFYRRFTKRLPKRLLLKLSYITVPLYYISKIPGLGPAITRVLLPVSIHPPNHQWRVGSTFDLYSPAYAFYYDHVEVFGWYEGAGLTRIRPTGPDAGVTYVATRPPIDDEDWA